MWALVVIFIFYSGATSFQIEFSNFGSCIEAGRGFLKLGNANTSICVNKATGKLVPVTREPIWPAQ